MQKHKHIILLWTKTPHTTPLPLSPNNCPHPPPPVIASHRQCTKTKTATAMAEARTMVMVATVLGRCLCCCYLIVDIAHHCPLPHNCPLCTIAIALATLAIILILPYHPRCHRPCPLCRHCRCSSITLVTIAIALLPSPSSMLAHWRCHCPHPCPPQLSLPPSPSLLLAQHLCCHCNCLCNHCHHHCHCLPPSLPLQPLSLLPLPSLTCHHCCRSTTAWGGEGRTIPIRCGIQLWPPLLVPPSSSPPLPPVQLARRGRSNNMWAFNAQQMACADVAGLLSEFL